MPVCSSSILLCHAKEAGSNVSIVVPFRFHGLYFIGCIFFILNIVFFLFNVIMISLRFHIHPRTFKSSLTHPLEALFIPAWIVSLGVILMNINQYGLLKTGCWLHSTMKLLYWVYCALAIASSCGIYLMVLVSLSHLDDFPFPYKCYL
jgi:tellurite resistance protein TehA-like permease